MRKQVINEEKMVERELHPSKDIPDLLENGNVMTIYWTLINGEPFSFVSIEDTYGDDDGDGETYSRPHTFELYGALYGKVYPWQVDLADLDKSRIVAIVKASSLASAQIQLFEKADEVMEIISVGRRADATRQQKSAAWKFLRHIEMLYDEAKLKASWFTSRHGISIERLLDGLIGEDEAAELVETFEVVQNVRRGKSKNKKRFGGVAIAELAY